MADIEGVLHELIDVVSGHQPSLPRDRALQLHEDITPGYNDTPMTDAEKAQLAALQERQERESAPPEAPSEGAEESSAAWHVAPGL